MKIACLASCRLSYADICEGISRHAKWSNAGTFASFQGASQSNRPASRAMVNFNVLFAGTLAKSTPLNSPLPAIGFVIRIVVLAVLERAKGDFAGSSLWEMVQLPRGCRAARDQPASIGGRLSILAISCVTSFIAVGPPFLYP